VRPVNFLIICLGTTSRSQDAEDSPKPKLRSKYLLLNFRCLWAQTHKCILPLSERFTTTSTACIRPSPKKRHWEARDVLCGWETRAVTASSTSIAYLPGPRYPRNRGDASVSSQNERELAFIIPLRSSPARCLLPWLGCAGGKRSPPPAPSRVAPFPLAQLSRWL